MREVLTRRCGTCHGNPPEFGAPIPLTTQSEFMAKTESGGLVRDSVLERIHTDDATLQMPPASQEAMPDDDRDTLDAWLSEGAKPVSEQCDPPAGRVDDDVDDDFVPEGVALECYPMLAHAPGDADAPFEVGRVRDGYTNFNFMPPWEGTAYARIIRSKIDNSEVLHHWLFFKNAGPTTDLSVEDSSGSHPSSELLYGWAPGGRTLNTYVAAGEDVGIEMPGDVGYTVEIHYNSSDANAVDASGLEVCVTREKPSTLATQAWLGTDGIDEQRLLQNDLKATGTCEPDSSEPIHIFGVSPHMHLKGRHMKGVINRADGSTEILHDGPFDFNDQTFYIKDVWLMPGDTITTTCTFSEPASFGKGTTEEMCYLFTMHTPAGALTDNQLAGRIAHGDNACLGPGNLIDLLGAL